MTDWLQQQQQGQQPPPRQQQAGELSSAACTVLTWLEEALRDTGPGPEVKEMMGFMRWGFVHAFRYVSSLLRASLTHNC